MFRARRLHSSAFTQIPVTYIAQIVMRFPCQYLVDKSPINSILAMASIYSTYPPDNSSGRENLPNFRGFDLSQETCPVSQRCITDTYVIDFSGEQARGWLTTGCSGVPVPTARVTCIRYGLRWLTSNARGKLQPGEDPVEGSPAYSQQTRRLGTVPVGPFERGLDTLSFVQ